MKSRKQRMTWLGLVCIAGTYSASLTMFYFKPETAGSVASLGQVAIVAVGGMVAAYVGAQGYVDGKTADQPPAPPAVLPPPKG